MIGTQRVREKKRINEYSIKGEVKKGTLDKVTRIMKRYRKKEREEWRLGKDDV